MHRLTLVGCCLVASLTQSPGVAHGSQPEGRWIGTVQFRGASWPICAEFPAEQDHALLGLPTLGMSHLSAPLERGDDSLTITLPFGLGIHTLPLGGDVLSSSPDEEPDRVRIVLERDKVSPPEEQVIRFESDDAQLVGTLYTPALDAAAAGPLVVCGHGAAPFHRGTPEYRFWAEFLTRSGFRVFLYDKRGVGESGGNHDTATLEQLTRDLIAATTVARNAAGVAPDRIALLGGSQFGWLAFPAARAAGVNTLVLSGAPAVDPITLETRVLYEVYTENGVQGADLADAMAYTRAYFAAARDPRFIRPLLDMAEQHRGSGWITLAPIPAGSSDLAWWTTNGGCDPAVEMRSFGGEVLAVYGANDQTVPPDMNAHRLEQLVAAGGGHAQIWIAPGADHRVEAPGGMIEGRFQFPRLAPGYLDRVEAFLNQRFNAAD